MLENLLRLDQCGIVKRANMLILAGFLEANIGKIQLHMKCWRGRLTGANQEIVDDIQLTRDKISESWISDDGLKVLPGEFCGTVGCAAGWAIFIIPPVDDDYDGDDELNFSRYCNRVFIGSGSNKTNLLYDDQVTHQTEIGGKLEVSDSNYIKERLFNWVFGWQWYSCDNTIEGVVYRIHFILNNPNVVPWSASLAADPEAVTIYEEQRDAWWKERNAK